jgi:hypothetical protein
METFKKRQKEMQQFGAAKGKGSPAASAKTESRRHGQ